MKSCAFAAFAVAGLAASASAQITSIPQFTGSMQEDFTVFAGFPHCVQGRVFDNRADLCTFDANGAPTNGAHTTGGWGFGCNIPSHTPPLLFGSSNGIATYTFDGTVSRFGGQFGINHDSVAVGAHIKFFDAENNQIGSDIPLTFEGCGLWGWKGWESTVPIKRIEVVGGTFGGGFVMMDTMQAEPGGGPPVCYPNCDESTTAPVLNVQDFTCFLQRYAAGESYANCDESTTAPVLNVQDFTCFLQSYAAGCP